MLRAPRRASARCVAALVAAGLLLAACSDDGGGAPDGGGGGGADGTTTTTVARPPLDVSAPCALVTGPEVAQAFQIGFADGVVEDTFGLAGEAPAGVTTQVCSWGTRDGGHLTGVALVLQTGADARTAFDAQRDAFAAASPIPIEDVEGLGDDAYEVGDLLTVLDGDVVFGVSTVATGATPDEVARHAAGRRAVAAAVLDR